MLPEYDVVIVADYGHGLFTDAAVSLLCERARFLAVNAQTNAGNRGFNTISKYPRADFISIDEPEARLEVRDEEEEIQSVIRSIAKKVDCPRFLVTRGSNGCLYYDGDFCEVPAFAVKLVDRIGAGDAVLAVTSLCVAKELPPEIVGFIGNVAGAEACATIGNKKAIETASFHRHIASLLK
jgi:sugar/nucleoside kinase (ribokinase family)